MKLEITKERAAIVIIGGVIIIPILLYAGVYSPLITELKWAHAECMVLEMEISEMRKNISTLEAPSERKYLIGEKDITVAIDELTKSGRAKDINFVSMTPKKIEKVELQYNILPIEIELESPYSKLGTFLGSLDELKKSLVTIRNFNVTRSAISPEKVRTRLVVNMYLTYAE